MIAQDSNLEVFMIILVIRVLNIFMCSLLLVLDPHSSKKKKIIMEQEFAPESSNSW